MQSCDLVWNCCEGLKTWPGLAYNNLKTALAEWKSSYRLCGLDGHKPVVALFPADIAKGPVVPGVLGDVADLVDWVVMQEHLHGRDVECYRKCHVDQVK